MIQLTNAHLTRQIDILPINKLNLPIKLVGAGAIGSFAALQLVKAGFTNLEVWDFDTVSVENMSCQFYRFSDIGKPKVQALKDLIKDFTNVEITVHNEHFRSQFEHQGLLIVAVDSMKARKEIFESVKSMSFQIKYLIDPRMGAEDAALYVMNPFNEKDVTTYAKTLYTDEAAVQERCTAKATIYTANLLSGLLVKAVKNLACSEAYPRTSLWSIKHNQLQSWASDAAK